MALGFTESSGGGGDFADLIKYDARAGRMFRADRTQTGSGWETNNVEITQGFTAVFDLENIQVGYALFAANQAPQFSMVPLGQPYPAKPSENHKQGFKVHVKLGKDCGNDIREFSSCAGSVRGALDKLHDEYTAGLAANPGKLPVVTMPKTVPIVSTGKGQSSTNYAPVFEIVKWVDRPEGLGAQKAAQPAQASQAAPAAQTAAAPAREMADANEF